MAQLRAGDISAAESTLYGALKSANSSELRNELAEVLTNLALLHIAKNELHQAQDVLEAADKLLRDSNDSVLILRKQAAKVSLLRATGRSGWARRMQMRLRSTVSEKQLGLLEAELAFDWELLEVKK